LFEAIEAGDFPSWTVFIQTLSPEEAETFKCPCCSARSRLILTYHLHIIVNVLDLTKDWDPRDVPLKEIGKFVLNQNP